MTPDEELMVIFGALHVIALALGVVLFMMFLRSDSTSSWKPPEEDEGGGGGGNDRLPSSKPKPRPDRRRPAARRRAGPHAAARPHQAARRPPAPAAPAGPPAHAAAHARPRPLSQQLLSSPIGFDSASSVTPPPVSGPSRRTRTHWTTGSPVPARHATRPLPVRRVSESRVLGS